MKTTVIKSKGNLDLAKEKDKQTKMELIRKALSPVTKGMFVF